MLLRFLASMLFGFVACKSAPAIKDVTNHRAADVACEFYPALPNSTPISCTTDDDCAGISPAGAKCSTTNGNFCTYDQCTLDSDCQSNGVCLCGYAAPYGATGYNPVYNACISGGNCRTDSDCGQTACSPSVGNGGVADVAGYFCHTANDSCVNDSDCGEGTTHRCWYGTSSHHWQCSTEPYIEF